MKIMKYILLTFALFYLNVSIWGQEKSIGITLEDVAGMKEKEKEQEKAMRTPRNTFIVNSDWSVQLSALIFLKKL